jgi:non-ribosomal peptide synthetase component F
MGGEALPELPIQYADFAARQREELQGERWEQLLGYWRRVLDGAPGALDLPTDFPREDQLSHAGAWHPFQLDAGIHAEIRRVCSETGTTPFMVLLAGWYVVLRRMTGETDILIGTDVANRNRRETEGLIGFFINQLALRVAAPRRISFRELLASVRTTTLGAYDHQDAPFDLLVEQLQPVRVRGRSPFFQVKFILNNATAAGRLQLPGVTVSPLRVENEVAKYDLTLAARETDDGIACFIEYRKDLFAPSTAARMASQLEALLRHVLADDGILIDDVPLHSIAEDAALPAALTAEAGLSRSDYEALLAQLGGAGVG